MYTSVILNIHPFLYFISFHLGCIAFFVVVFFFFFRWLQSSDVMFATDENTSTKGLLSKLIQPELNNFTTLHPSAVVMEPLETRAVPTGMNQASEHETEFAVADAPSQRRREESRRLSHNDTSKNTISTVGTLV